jgi:transposase
LPQFSRHSNWIGVEELKRTKYTAEFKEEAIKQVIDKSPTVVDVAKRLGISEDVLCT